MSVNSNGAKYCASFVPYLKFVLALIRFEEILAMGFDDEHSDSQFGGPPDAGSRPTFIS
jgi:hypothetical protein